MDGQAGVQPPTGLGSHLPVVALQTSVALHSSFFVHWTHLLLTHLSPTLQAGLQAGFATHLLEVQVSPVLQSVSEAHWTHWFWKHLSVPVQGGLQPPTGGTHLFAVHFSPVLQSVSAAHWTHLLPTHFSPVAHSGLQPPVVFFVQEPLIQFSVAAQSVSSLQLTH